MLKTDKKLTLVFPFDEIGGRLLLGWKKRGFGHSKFNGFGGKVEAGETIEEGAARELWEEAAIRVSRLQHHGIIEFFNESIPGVSEVHVFLADGWLGEPQETEEMAPQWFPLADIPYDLMWPDDRIWLPLLLQRRFFRAQFTFDAHNASILAQCVTEFEQPLQ